MGSPAPISPAAAATLARGTPAPEDAAADTATDTAAVDEQRLRHARPLYVAHFFATWCDHMWDFAVIILLAELFPRSLLPASLYGLGEGAAGIICGPAIGRFVDTHDRLVAMRGSIIGQNTAVTVAALLLGFVFADVDAWSEGDRWAAALFVTGTGTVVKVSNSMNEVSFHKDWCVVVADDSPSVLTHMNVMLQRADMASTILAPTAVGLASALAGTSWCCVGMAAWASASTLIEIAVATYLFNDLPTLQGKAEAAKQRATVDSSNEATGRSGVRAAACQWMRDQAAALRRYREHPAFGFSLPYALLGLSVLSLQSTMVAFLHTAGVSDLTLAAARALGAIVAFAATFAVPPMIRSVGLLRTAGCMLNVQAVCAVLILVAFTVVAAVLESTEPPAVFPLAVIGGLVAGRFGVWGFEASQMQVMQVMVERDHAGVINGAQLTAVNTFQLASFALTIVFDDPHRYFVPVACSTAAILAAATLFGRAESEFQRTHAAVAEYSSDGVPDGVATAAGSPTTLACRPQQETPRLLNMDDDLAEGAHDEA